MKRYAIVVYHGDEVHTLRLEAAKLDRLIEIVAAERGTLARKLRILIENEIAQNEGSKS